jgi:hypothetical protein
VHVSITVKQPRSTEVHTRSSFIFMDCTSWRQVCETLHRASDSLLAFCLKISPTKKFCDHCTFECHRRHFSFLFIAGLSKTLNPAINMCELEPRSESLIRSLLEGMGGRGGRGREGASSVASISFLPSFSDPHAGLCHQGQ